MGHSTHSMGSWVGPPQARRLMFMTIPEKYKLWNLGLCSKNFEKLVRFFFEKIFSSKIFHWISEQKYFSTNIFEREKIAKCWYFRDFFSRKCGSKKYFSSEIQWKNFEENMFSKKNRTNFSKFLEHSTKLQSLYFSGMVMNINLRACGDPTQLPMLCVEYPISYWIIIQLQKPEWVPDESRLHLCSLRKSIPAGLVECIHQYWMCSHGASREPTWTNHTSTLT